MFLRCSKCGHEWDYRGKAIIQKVSLFVTCPSCLRKIILKRQINFDDEEDGEINVSN